jgi:YD repeat-containing protein
MVTEEEYPSGARILNTFNDAGQLLTVGRKKTAGSPVTTLASGLKYMPMGGLTEQVLGNGLKHSVQYNSRMQATTIQLTKPGTSSDLLKLEYDYNGVNNNGNVGQIKITQDNAAAAQFTQTFEYDGLNRLKTAKENGGTNWTQTYNYDRFGNRTSVVGTNPQTLGIDPATNRLLTGPGYGYDGAGNLTAEPGGKSYVFDAENRLTEARLNGVTVGRYHYDGEGKRVKKVVGTGAPLRMVYGVGGNLVDEYEGASVTANAPTKEYVYGAAGMLAELEFPCPGKAAYKYVTPDALGTPRILTNPAGAVISRHDYLPFGEELAPSIGNRSVILGYGQVDKVRKKFDLCGWKHSSCKRELNPAGFEPGLNLLV